jgi:hypothetical protein
MTDIYVDVFETITLRISSLGLLLSSEVAGQLHVSAADPAGIEGVTLVWNEEPGGEGAETVLANSAMNRRACVQNCQLWYKKMRGV